MSVFTKRQACTYTHTQTSFVYTPRLFYLIFLAGKCGSQVIIPYRGDQYDVDRLKILGDLGQVLFQVGTKGAHNTFY